MNTLYIESLTEWQCTLNSYIATHLGEVDTNLGWCGVFYLVLLGCEDPEYGGLACIVQPQDQDAQLAARLLAEFA